MLPISCIKCVIPNELFFLCNDSKPISFIGQWFHIVYCKMIQIVSIIV